MCYCAKMVFPKRCWWRHWLNSRFLVLQKYIPSCIALPSAPIAKIEWKSDQLWIEHYAVCRKSKIWNFRWAYIPVTNCITIEFSGVAPTYGTGLTLLWHGFQPWSAISETQWCDVCRKSAPHGWSWWKHPKIKGRRFFCRQTTMI